MYLIGIMIRVIYSNIITILQLVSWNQDKKINGDYCFVGYNTTEADRNLSAFQRNLLPPPATYFCWPGHTVYKLLTN
jgi:hypothetical protein